jgi:hypothetical protein
MQDLSSMMDAVLLRVFGAHTLETPVMRLRGFWRIKIPEISTHVCVPPVDTPVMRLLYYLTDTFRIACEYVQTMPLRCQC